MIIIDLNFDNEATNLQRLSRALNDPDEDFFVVDEGPISSAIASAIEKLLLSTKHQNRWRVNLDRCYLNDEEAQSIFSQAFYKAFSQGRIGLLTLNGLDSTVEEGRDMLLAVFGTSGPNNGSQHNPMKLNVGYCIFDQTIMPHLQSWARDAAAVSELTIRGDCFRWPDTPTTTECVVKMFEQAREKPTDLHFLDVSLIGNMESLWDWRLVSISIERSSQVHTLSGLSSMAPTLKKLVINPYDHVNNSLAEMDIGIIALLEDPKCCLEDLTLSSKYVENPFTLAFFQALGSIRSLISLDIFTINDPSIWHAMLDYLRSNPPSLTDLSVHDSMILGIPSAADDICDMLRSENTTLEKFRLYEFGYTENRELKFSLLPYLVRNQAGRRILLDEQVPSSLMAEVLGRTQQMEIDCFYRVRLDKSNALRADATYHLVREGLAFLFS